MGSDVIKPEKFHPTQLFENPKQWKGGNDGRESRQYTTPSSLSLMELKHSSTQLSSFGV
jgi:hypothetical protein